MKNRNILKAKIEKINLDLQKLISEILNQKIVVFHYGAYDINPKYLVFWICVDTDEIKERLDKDKKVIKELKDILVKNEYPSEAINSVHIGFESHETVNRESKGNWFLHFK